jgi:hypothetical protein
MQPMSRRPDPLRLYAAHRAGLSQRLQAQARLSEDTAERWITSWESAWTGAQASGGLPRGIGSPSSADLGSRRPKEALRRD